MGIFIGKVVDIFDEQGGDRIKVFIPKDDRSTSTADLDYAFPLLPKNIMVKPKVNETVLVLTNDENTKHQRFYIGPIVSQPQNMYFEDISSSLNLMKGAKTTYIHPRMDLYPRSKGCYGEDDEVVIYGRKNSDIIISDDDIRIRCGARLFNPNAKKEEDIVKFNSEGDPAFIKLNFYESPIRDSNGNEIKSTANVVAQHINLISTEGNPYFENISDRDAKMISDETIKKILDEAHQLPYGDKLIEFLDTFVTAFACHTHNYTNEKPVADSSYQNLMAAWDNIDSILSKNVRIN